MAAGRLVLGVMLVVVLNLSRSAVRGQPQRLNVLFIMIDDMGWGDVSYHGNRQIFTPNIDVLAQDGVILGNYYVQPVCTPSRAALMTGAYPIRYGLQGRPLRANQRAGLNITFKIMPEYFKEAGYATHIVGKWHLGHYQPRYTPLRRGFDSHVGIYNGGSDYWNHFHIDLTTGRSALDLRYNDQPYWNVSGTYVTHIYRQRAIQVIYEEASRSQPFFLYVAPTAVHCAHSAGAIQSPAEHRGMYSYIGSPTRIQHAGTVHEADMLVGEIVKALYDTRQLEKTIIVIASDNGGMPIGFTYNSSPNYPLRGTKGTVGEGGVHVPALFWAPNMKTRGTINMQLFHITDWLPTLMHAAGWAGDRVRCKDGVDQWDVLMYGAQSPRTEILIQYNGETKQYALRSGNFKILSDAKNVLFNYYDWYKPEGKINPDPNAVIGARQRSIVANVLRCLHGPEFGVSPEVSLIQGRYPPGDSLQMGTSCNPSANPCLFDLSVDPYETNNLYASNKAKFDELYERLQFYARAAKPLVNEGVDASSDPYLDGSGFWKSWVSDNDNSLPSGQPPPNLED